MTRASDWDDTLADLERRRQRSFAMGGQDRLAAHHANGKLDARARIDRLVDRGNFHELGTLAGGEVAADGIVVGTTGSGTNSKRYRIAELAVRNKIPLVMLLEGAGFRPGKHGGRSSTDLIAQAKCSGRVPTVAAVRWWRRSATSAS